MRPVETLQLIDRRYSVAMTTDTLAKALDDALAGAGFLYRTAPASIADQLARDMDDLRSKGLLSEAYWQEYARAFSFIPSPEVPDSRTLLVVAWVSPAVKVVFHLDTGPLEAVIPPTYLASAGQVRCLEILETVLNEAGHSVARVRAPNKLLAVRTGLARYGRNNLAYVEGMGSYARVDVYCTDAELQAREPEARGIARLNACSSCHACHFSCPTSAIPYDGSVIDALRCLTHLNENGGAWPDWVDHRAHNSLLGCMRCQEPCPANRSFLRRKMVVAEFDEEETMIILEGRTPDLLPAGLRAKLERIDLGDDSDILGRNLLALRDAARPVSAA